MITSSANRGGNFYLFLSNLDAFYFSNVISVAGTCNTMLNRNGESGPPCLVLELWEKAFILLPLSMMVTVVFFFSGVCALSDWGSSLLVCWGGYCEGCLILSNPFFCICKIILWFLSFILLIMVYYRNWILEITPALYSCYKSHLVMVCNLFISD